MTSLPLRHALSLLAMLVAFPAAAEFTLPGDKIKQRADYKWGQTRFRFNPGPAT